MGFEQLRRPIESFAAQPGWGEAGATMGRQHVRDGGLVGFGRCRREGERDLAEAKLEQAVAAAGLAVVVAFRCRPGGRNKKIGS